MTQTAMPTARSLAKSEREQFWLGIVIAAAAAGIVCRIAQYLSNQSFWHDEAFLILNLLARSPHELLGKLTLTVAGQQVPPQSASPGYLLALKGLCNAWGPNELALRLPALLGGIADVVLFALLARRTLLPVSAAIAVALLALSDPLIDHSVLVKPYTCDVAAGLVLLLIASGSGSSLRRLAMASVATTALCWCSLPLVFVFGGVALAVLPDVIRSTKTGWIRGMLALFPAAISCGILYLVCLRHQRDPALYADWQRMFPDYRHAWTVPIWILRRLFDLCEYPYRGMGAIVLPLACLGVYALWTDGRRQWLLALVMPIAATLAASLAYIYPFGGTRICLFLLPMVVLLAVSGIEKLSAMLPLHRRRWAVAAALPMLASGAALAAFHLISPRCTSHVRPAVQYAQTHLHSGDRIVIVGANSWPSVLVYWPNPPGLAITYDGTDAPLVPGRFWCICEYAPGEFDRKRKAAVALVSGDAIAGDSFVGRGGAALLFDRPAVQTPSTSP